MTPEQNDRYAHLKWKQERLATGMQRMVDALANAAFERAVGMRADENESDKIAAYELVLARLDELMEEERQLLIEAGILKEDQDNPGA